jgi:HNH endonuclease
MAKRSTADRFWSKVEVGADDECWLWTANTTGASGYGLFHSGRTAIVAHRWSYQEAKGPIPDGLVIDHTCRTRLCVNPSHLEPRTNRDNVLLGVGPTAINAAKTHCDRGHPLPERIDGVHRFCAVCAKETRRRWQKARESDPAWRDHRRALARARFAERYKNDPEYRAKMIAKARANYVRRKELADGQ